MTGSPQRIHVTRPAAVTEQDRTRTADAAPPLEPVRVVVDDMRAALDRYFALGCEVHATADGWVLLGSGAMRFVLVAPMRGRSGRDTRLAGQERSG